jgi:hypothetical protein
MHQVVRYAVACLAACGLVALAIAGTSAPAIASGGTKADHCVTAKGNGSTVTLGQAKVEAGNVCFAVSTVNPGTPGGMGGSSVQMFQLNKGATMAQALKDFVNDFASTFPTEAKGTQGLLRDVTFYGLADVTAGHPETVTENLRPGTYYVWDAVQTFMSRTWPPVIDTLTVTKGGQGGRLHAPILVKATDADRFIAPTTWPHEGTYLLDNVSDEFHIMDIVPVAPGTTDKQLQAFFNANSNVLPVNIRTRLFVPGPSGGNDAIAAGNSIRVTYNLPPGRYVLICWVPDDDEGMPHAYMGMHEVITLR